MQDGASHLFTSLNTYSDLKSLIDNGHSEGLYLECKAPAAPTVSKDIRITLAKALSGFSNANGGVIIWGMATVKHAHSGLDILAQIEPIGNCRSFKNQLEKAIPLLSIPPIIHFQHKLILAKHGDSMGVVLTYVPKWDSDPVQSSLDNCFYYRSGDDFSLAPYEMIKRLFATTRTPDLTVVTNEMITKKSESGEWRIPISLQNNSSAIAEHVKVTVLFQNPDVIENIYPHYFRDISGVNANKRVYSMSVNDDVIHKGFGLLAGFFNIKLKNIRVRSLKFKICLFANNMRAKSIEVSCLLNKQSLRIGKTTEEYLY